ncbi:putative fasciclin-like arabinogalactan protein 20 [Phoenix dactylifera]|uniref:Fasciclin-like arabinogalactan protein 20 n=1 Tax=Phoenix dactylifera TaxID=42345 RepID=A0A8B7CVK2_PHODC|nr:putative fasciclin-like arabinogalactan protein 20 [Phoenix dactylifera]
MWVINCRSYSEFLTLPAFSSTKPNQIEHKNSEPPLMALHLLSVLLLSVLPFSSPLSISPQALANAVESLSAAGYVSMALTLNLTSQMLLPHAAAGATLFSPSDAAFSDSGQPPFSLLRFHLAPQRLRPKTLRSLSHGAEIPTLAPNLSLLITTSATDGRVSLNGVRINESALFDNASLIVYAADDFFDPSFRISSLPAQSLATPGSVIQCQPPNPSRSLAGASAKLRSMGYSSIAAFLDVQLEWGGSKGATVFAPGDAALGACQGNFSEHLVVFRRHVVPCRLSGSDLAELGAGTVVPTFAEDFTIIVDRSDGRSLLNGVPVSDEDLFDDGSVVVHGVRDVLKPLDASVDFGS